MKTHLVSRAFAVWVCASVLPLAMAAGAVGASELSLLGGRFRVSAAWSTAQGHSGEGHAVPLSDESGYFWFFRDGNTEVVVKLIDACGEPYDRFWFFASGLTNVGVELTVEDTFTDVVRTYGSPVGTNFEPLYDTAAFATCGAAQACGLGTPAALAASPREDEELESLALFLSGEVVADEATYRRVVADVKAIRGSACPPPGEFYPPFAPGRLILGVEPDTAAQIGAGTYTAWDCLNGWYRLQDSHVLIAGFLLLTFEGRYDIEQVAAEYAALPGVLSAEPDHVSFFPYGYPPLVCGIRQGETHHYFFDGGFQDPSVSYFVSAAGSPPTFVERSDLVPPPEWYELYEDCLEQNTPVEE
jgi:hypothetical protein